MQQFHHLQQAQIQIISDINEKYQLFVRQALC